MLTVDDYRFILREPLSKHTTLQVGGPATWYIKPGPESFLEDVVRIFRIAQREHLPVFILGAGSNLLVSDNGFNGIVLDTTAFSGCVIETRESGIELVVQAGTASDAAANFAFEHGLSGMEFLAGLPGTIGGAVWMNARCYERSMSDILIEVTILEEGRALQTVPFKPKDYGYKKSPFQEKDALILDARLSLTNGNRAEIGRIMDGYRQDRKEKGHFAYPSAGSIFKNNHAWGKPSGKIIEELGLRGTQIGGAKIADWHGNLLINTGGASAADIYALIAKVEKTAYDQLGISLEPEIIFLGFSDDFSL